MLSIVECLGFVDYRRVVPPLRYFRRVHVGSLLVSDLVTPMVAEVDLRLLFQVLEAVLEGGGLEALVVLARGEEYLRLSFGFLLVAELALLVDAFLLPVLLEAFQVG